MATNEAVILSSRLTALTRQPPAPPIPVNTQLNPPRLRYTLHLHRAADSTESTVYIFSFFGRDCNAV